MPKQLTDAFAETLRKKLRARIDFSLNQIEKIKTCEDTADNKKQAVKTVQANIANMQVSYRMTANTGWCWAYRQNTIKTYEQKIKETTKLKEKELYQSYIDALTRSLKCNKCAQRGYTAINAQTGIFTLCSCTTKTIHLY